MQDKLAIRKRWAQCLDHAGAFNCYSLDLLFVHAESDTALEWGCGIIQMKYYFSGTSQTLEIAFDQVFPCLTKHLNCHVIRNAFFINQHSGERKFCVGG
ncbi:MAG: hypothetical protein BWY82_02341 [Verrucomicrobia bacterium ADurb.Bin474]|nr:MAG: hypothetical protein BWY82_02341 [Verrucomicrobia bacterium ADurb.Bin474]